MDNSFSMKREFELKEGLYFVHGYYLSGWRENDIEELYRDQMILMQDSMDELRAMLNYKADEEIPQECSSVVKELVLIRYNRDGTEGIVSESQSSGGSTTYTDELPDRAKRIIRRHRRLPR